MADIDFSDGGRRKGIIRRILSFLFKTLLILLLVFLALALIYFILNKAGAYGAADAIDSAASFVFDGIDRAIDVLADFLLTPTGVLVRQIVMTALGCLLYLAILWKAFVRGCWKLILRPYTVVTTLCGLALMGVIAESTGPMGMYGIGFFRFVSQLFFFPIQLVSMAAAHFGHGFEIPFAVTWYGSIVFFYGIILFLFVRFRVWLQFTRKMHLLGPSPALDLCNEVVKEARKHTKGIPSKMRFYIVNDDSVNAFAFDYNKVALHSGLLVNDQEWIDEEVVRAVIAHELGHIAHHDVLSSAIANANFLVFFFIVLIPYYFAAGMIDGKNEGGTGLIITLVALFIMLVSWIIRTMMNGVHYICYLLGGKREEYGADKFAVKIGMGKGLLAFMVAYSDAPSGGFSDPHPSMKNRALHLVKWMGRSRHEAYQDLDIKRLEEIVR